MSKVVAVRKDERGRITDYKLDNGKVLNHKEAVCACYSGEMEGCTVFTNRSGGDSIRSDRGQYDYKLLDLPEF